MRTTSIYQLCYMEQRVPYLLSISASLFTRGGLQELSRQLYYD